jgi:peptidoglycan/LPS O-acetylase OafA/YrhL
MWVGVELFFLISGFVILMTLERSTGIRDFAIRRWLRLFPAMLLCSILIFVFSRTTELGPYYARKLVDFIPGLTFISPALIHAITGASVGSMDGPFWSLYVEVCFYVIFGTFFFLAGEIVAILFISCLFFAAAILWIIFPFPGVTIISRISAAFDWIGFIYFGWFASGALYYLFTKTRDVRLFVLATAMAIISSFSGSFFSKLGTAEHVALLLVIALFSTALLSPRIQSMLSVGALVFVGFVSYPLYLFHNNMIVGLTQWIGSHSQLSSTAPIPPIILAVAIAWIIAKFAEPPIKHWLSKILTRRRLSAPETSSLHP